MWVASKFSIFEDLIKVRKIMSNYFSLVKDYLIELEFSIIKEDPKEELYIVEKPSAGIVNLIVDCEDPILVIEGVLFEVKEKSPELLEMLLRKNRELVHGAFAMDEEGNKIIFRDTLQLENLDLNELEGTINSLELLLSEHIYDLIPFAK